MSDNPPLARRMPGFDARHATRRARRTRIVAALLLVGIGLAAIVVVLLGRGQTHPTASHRPSAGAAPAPRVAAAIAPWRLAAPISRTVVVPWTTAGADQLVILGGATTGGTTASGIFGLDVSTGVLTEVGYLMNTLKDAAGAVLGGQVVVFGGTTASGSASASVQSFPLGAPSPSAAAKVVPESTVLGSLPQPRRAAVAVSAGATVYLVGGDSGSGPDPAVLATTDGTHFTTVATLPVPVDFPAAAALGDKLYVFGGTASTVAGPGGPVDTIQVVDLTTHAVTATRHLPVPVTGSSAIVLAGHVLVAGGDTTAPAVPRPGATTVAGGSIPPSTPTASSLSTVWGFYPTSGRTSVAGSLGTPVARSAVSVLGSTAWFVGGESNGTAVAAVQTLTLVSQPARTTTTTRPATATGP